MSARRQAPRLDPQDARAFRRDLNIGPLCGHCLLARWACDQQPECLAFWMTREAAELAAEREREHQAMAPITARGQEAAE